MVAGTSDYAYGHGNCAALATSNPANAVKNADSHEYFAENTPARSMGLKLVVYSLLLILLLVLGYRVILYRKRHAA